MATSAIDIVSTVWTKITDAGESGTVWKKTGGTIVIDHTDQETAATLPLTNTNVKIDKSKRIPLDGDNDQIITIPADNVDDIYYALAINDDDSNILTVDVI